METWKIYSIMYTYVPLYFIRTMWKNIIYVSHYTVYNIILFFWIFFFAFFFETEVFCENEKRLYILCWWWQKVFWGTHIYTYICARAEFKWMAVNVDDEYIWDDTVRCALLEVRGMGHGLYRISSLNDEKRF